MITLPRGSAIHARSRVKEVLQRAQIPQLPVEVCSAFSVDDAVTQSAMPTPA